MTQERVTPNSGDGKTTYQKVVAGSYYALLGLHPSASVREIRQSYWDLSKLYHPDTTTLPKAIATAKFQQLNEAYATLSNPERRSAYDRKIGYSSIPVVNPLPSLNRLSTPYRSSSAYLDPTDRPLSPGEIFALFILALTFVCCLVLAIAIGLTRGENALQTVTTSPVSPSSHGQTIVAKPATSELSKLEETIPPKPKFAPPIPDVSASEQRVSSPAPPEPSQVEMPLTAEPNHSLTSRLTPQTEPPASHTP